MGAQGLSFIQLKSSISPELRKSIEVLLFVHNQPLSLKKFKSILDQDVSSEDIQRCLQQISREFALADKPYSLEKISGGWQLLTRPEYHGMISKLVEVEKQETLTRAQLETLSVIAYSQPIIKYDIESIRGVGCGPVLKILQEKDFIRVVGKAEKLGAPSLYGTTSRFLDIFGLEDISELPEREDIIKTFKQKLHHSSSDSEQNAEKN